MLQRALTAPTALSGGITIIFLRRRGIILSRPGGRPAGRAEAERGGGRQAAEPQCGRPAAGSAGKSRRAAHAECCFSLLHDRGCDVAATCSLLCATGPTKEWWWFIRLRPTPSRRTGLRPGGAEHPEGGQPLSPDPAWGARRRGTAVPSARRGVVAAPKRDGAEAARIHTGSLRTKPSR